MTFQDLVHRQKSFFQSGATLPVAFRRARLEGLLQTILKHEDSLAAAAQSDLGKSPFQTWSTELGVVTAEIRHALKHLRSWTSPSRVSMPWFVAPARGQVQPVPLGVACILGPWNYPFQLVLTPLASALAAGNCAILKPSELAPRCAEALTAMIKDAFPPELVTTVTGGPEAAVALLEERFDKIFFTGSTRIGRKVMAAAAKHLTPVTLELGGKCPAIVCEDAPVELAARRIAWGKFLNAGQTCVAPDVVFVNEAIHERFIAALKDAIRSFYGPDPARSQDYGRIVNDAHFQRLTTLMPGGRIACGGQSDGSTRYMAPTVLTDVPMDAPVMQEEIFGPILPVIPFKQLVEPLRWMESQPAPLAVYAFTSDSRTGRQLAERTRSGAFCVNDVVSHAAIKTLPFGGVGHSGLGAYHGRAGFLAFSHQRSVMRRANWLDLPFRYPPQKIPVTALKRAMRFLLG